MGGVVVVCSKKWKLYFHFDPEFWSKLSSKTLKSGKILRKTALKMSKKIARHSELGKLRPCK